jgi:hypothetical protein
MPSDPVHYQLISRREAIRRVSAMLGGVALVGQVAMLAGCEERTRAGSAFSGTDIAFLDEVADTILPETATPGAKAAGVGAFIAMMVADTYDEREQKVFRDGLQAMEAQCREMLGKSFMSATPAERLSLLEKLDAEQVQYMRAVEGRNGSASDAMPHYFRMVKELTLLGYFTSEIGYTQAMRYEETPGRYDPCAPYKPGDKTWAPHA